jgi:hypothetical protein
VDDEPQCCNDYTHGPAVGGRPNGMIGDTPVVDLLCYDCLHAD